MLLKLHLKIVHHLLNASQKIDGTTVDGAEDLDLEHSSNYSYVAGSLFSSKDEVANFKANIANNSTFKSFMYEAEILEKTVPGVNNSILKKMEQ